MNPEDVTGETLAQPTWLERFKDALVDTDSLDTIPDPVSLIGDGMMFTDSVVWLVGKPGSYKSFIALDLAGCIAQGVKWQGHQVYQGKVLYLAAEGASGMKKRVRAWEKTYDLRMRNVDFLPMPVQAKQGEQWSALVELAAELKYTFIVLDTQARMTVGIEENSNTDMGVFMEAVENLRRAAGAAVVLVHHIGRNGDTGRGASAMDGALGTVIKVTKTPRQPLVTLQCEKNKDGEEWDDVKLRLVPEGKSLVVQLASKPYKRTDVARTTMKRLHGWWSTFGDGLVTVAELDTAEVFKSSTFYREAGGLVDLGLIEKIGEGQTTRYRMPGDPSQGLPHSHP